MFIPFHKKPRNLLFTLCVLGGKKLQELPDVWVGADPDPDPPPGSSAFLRDGAVDVAVWRSRGGRCSRRMIAAECGGAQRRRLPSSSPPGWQGHPGARTAEFTRYFTGKKHQTHGAVWTLLRCFDASTNLVEVMLVVAAQAPVFKSLRMCVGANGG